MSYRKHLFVAVGATGAMYTLRETYLREQWVGGQSGYMHREVSSFHHYNLGQDAAEAWSKAQAAAEKLELPLDGSLDDLQCQMRDIKRASAEEMERRRKAEEEEREFWRQQRAAEAAAWREENADLVDALRPYDPENGESSGDHFLDGMAVALAQWGKLTDGQARAVRNILERRALQRNSRHVGEIGQRIELQLTVDRVLDWSYGQFPTIYRYCTLARDAAGNVIQYVGAKPLDDGTYKATVAEHDEYRGVRQTKIKRPKWVEVPQECPAIA
jgi:hypothetical protein